MSDFTAEELQLLEIIGDEVRWADVELGWNSRWYQEQILRQSTTRTVLRCGRRVGKTDCACVRVLYRAFTKPERALDESYVVLILTPFETQIDLIFKRLRELINRSTLLKASVVKDTKNPQEITLANGARITGYTVGSKSGGGGANVRGQRADFLYLDEVDYMNEQDINTVLAIALEDPDRIEIFASSTPSGKREHFYRWCTNKELGWKEFHFPSSVNPSWSKQTEQEFRESLSELAYIQEIEAEFGEEQAGVYNKAYLDESYTFAMKNGFIEYAAIPYQKQGPRAIGIDWDVVQATPTFVGVEWWPEWKKFRVFLRVQMPKVQFTLDNAVNELIRLHALWDFDYLVVDRGFGEMQVETLKKYAVNHPEANLAGRIFAHTFSDKINVRDPHTHQNEKKPLKPFAVKCTVVSLERQALVLNPGDNQMRRQLESYRVVSVSSDGRPVYTNQNEHMVDGLNLAMLYLTLKHDDLFKLSYATAVRYIQPDHGPEMRQVPSAIPEGVKVRTFQSGSSISMVGPGRSMGRSPSRMPTHFRTLF